MAKQARLFVRAALSIVEHSPLLLSLIETQSEDELVFRNGAAISAFPCSSRGARGWAISQLMMDEAAFFLTDTDGAAVAGRVFNALVPATAQFGDKARVIVSSTPWGKDGLFATLYQHAVSGELANRAHFGPQRGRPPAPFAISPAKRQLLRVPPWGPWCRTWSPAADSCGHGLRPELVGSAFPLQKGGFVVTAGRAMIALLDP